MRRRKSAPDVASTDDYRQFDSQLLDLGNLLGQFLNDLGRDVITAAFFAQGLAAKFEYNTFVMIGSHRILSGS